MPTYFTPCVVARTAIAENHTCRCSEIYGSGYEVEPEPIEEVMVESKTGEFVHRDAHEILVNRFLSMKYGKTNMRLVRKINRGSEVANMTPEKLYMACKNQVNDLKNEPLVFGETSISPETINEIYRAKIEG